MKKKIEIETPLTPNFIRIKGTDQLLHVSQFTNRELEAIARLWAGDIIKKARMKRSQDKLTNIIK